MKIVKILLFLIISNALFINCSPIDKLIRHQKKIDLLVKNYPELRKNLALDSLIIRDTLLITIHTRDTVRLEIDSAGFLSKLDSISFYKQSIDSLQALGINTQKEKDKLERLKNSLLYGAYTEKSFTIDIPITYNYNNDTVTTDYSILLFLSKGKLFLSSDDTLNLLYKKTDYTLNITKEKKLNFISWIRDEKTLSLLVILFLIILILIFKR